MSPPLFALDGMLSRHALVLDDVLDHVAVESEGRLLVAMVDVLAIVRLDRDADVLLVEFLDGTSRAFRMADVLGGGDVFLRLGIERRICSSDEAWLARLWSPEVGSSPVVVSVRATTFAAFVGAS
jgi:hypothetical protein